MDVFNLNIFSSVLKKITKFHDKQLANKIICSVVNVLITLVEFKYEPESSSQQY